MPVIEVGICGPCEGRVRRFGLDTGEVAITGLKQPCGAFVAICESSFGRRQKPHQICRGLQVYPAKQGAENGQKDKQVKARGLPRGSHRPAEPVGREKSRTTGL